LHNIAFLRGLAGDSPGATGRIVIGQCLNYGISGVEFAAYAATCLILFGLTGSYIMLGGAVSCLALTRKHLALAARHRRKAVEARPSEDRQS